MRPKITALSVLSSAVAAGIGLWLAYKYFYRKKLGKRGAVKSLYIYPVKSCAGIKLEQAEITKIGVLLDRSWALLNSKGSVQTMRQLPKMALIQPSCEETKYLCLDAPGMPTLKLDMDVDESEVEKKMLDHCGMHGEGLDCGDEAGKWFDEYLGKPGHRLFNGCSECLKRRELKDHAVWGNSVQPDDKMVYQDSSPIMMVSEASLEAVNKELENPVDIRTFRPSIFIEGCFEFEEDSWQSVQIGNVLLRKLRQNTRCVLTTVDMDAGVKRNDGEPLETLKRICVSKGDDARYGQRPLFGNHFVADIPGQIHVGDDVTVLA
ncbi:mitochondrial amidoxime reducing component 2-like [Paramuricea clavata]|uniref:Mitochondrial amidoxime reducing component 2-like n=1 Tax=Paramuricea clavata TaxID=317549 RepID=A0A6S7JPG7_PARCT|nr:mitochondrial amidoxime reducing component 2-like [Paramuricea clavata]